MLSLAVMLMSMSMSISNGSPFFTDDFNSNHDYLSNGVSGTGWDGFIYNAGFDGTQNTVVEKAETSNGELTLMSKEGNWENAADDGVFLYVNIAAGTNFTVNVYVSNYVWTSWHDIGIMARAATGTTEDYVMSRLHITGNVNNALRSVNNNVTSNNDGTNDPAMYYLQLEKSGSMFIVRASEDGIAYKEIAAIDRTDMENVDLQVGLYQATFSGNTGDVSFDDFSIELNPIAQSPTPFNGESMVNIDAKLSWEMPDAYVPEGYDIYIGSDPNMNGAFIANWENSTIDPAADMSYALNNDVTYYWRVDSLEPNGMYPILHEGEMWSFTTLPPSPVITVNPASQTVAAGTTIDLSLTAINTDTYTWYQSLDTIADEGDTYVGTGSVIQVQINDISDEGWYYCVASSEAGTETSAMAHVMTKRLVSHWEFEGDLTDSVANGGPVHNGTATDPTYAVGKIGSQAFQFHGDERIVTIDDSVDYYNFYPQGLTIGCWV